MFDGLSPPKNCYPVAIQVAVMLSIRKYKTTDTLDRVLKFRKLYLGDDPTLYESGDMVSYLIKMREGLKGKGGGIQLVTDIAGKALYLIETWLEDASTRMTKAPSKSLSLATYIES